MNWNLPLALFLLLSLALLFACHYAIRHLLGP